MAYERKSFSKSVLIGLPPAPVNKRAYYSDTREPGLVLCVTGTGTKSFQVYIKQRGRPVRVTLGKFSPSLADSQELPGDCKHNDFLANAPELNVRMARALAALVKIDLKAGVNPADTKRAKRAELTLGQLFEEYWNRHLIPHAKKTADQMRADFERYIGELSKAPKKKHGATRTKAPGSVNWSKRLISTITRGEVQKLHADLGRECSHSNANRVIQLLKPMFNRAIEWGLFKGENPAVGVKQFRINSRERFLQSDELPRFFEALAGEPSTDVREYILLSLLTGARRSNVLSVRWADVNLERETWTMPDTKNGSPLTVPLMPEAVQILANRKLKKAAEFVFPGKGRTGHLVDLKCGWKRVFDRDEITQLTTRISAAGGDFEWPALRNKPAGNRGPLYESLAQSLARARKVAAEMEVDTTGARIPDVHIHDMRRTLGSWQAATGASLVVIGKSLGHKNLASTQIYSRLNIDPVRDSMQTATRAMLVAGGMLPTADVTPITAGSKSKHKAA